MMNFATILPAGLGEFVGVVAVGTPDHQHDIGALGQLHRRTLSLLGRLADSVHKPHFSRRKTILQVVHQFMNTRDRLCGLRHHAVPSPKGQSVDIIFAQHHIVLRQVLGKAAHLHVPSATNHDRVISVLDQLANLFVCMMHQRAGCIPEFQATLPRAHLGSVRGTVRRDHHRLRLYITR